jgi:hypothetical protein
MPPQKDEHGLPHSFRAQYKQRTPDPPVIPPKYSRPKCKLCSIPLIAKISIANHMCRACYGKALRNDSKKC